MGSASSVMTTEALHESVHEEHEIGFDDSTSQKILCHGSLETPETTMTSDDKPTLVHQSCDSESIRVFAEGLGHHEGFLKRVKSNRIDVIEAERYITTNPDVLFVTDERGESVASYAAFNRNAGLSCLFNNARTQLRMSAKMSPKGITDYRVSN